MLTHIHSRARGITLLELLVVLMILSIILTAAVRTWDVTLERGRAETTWRKLNQLVGAIIGDPDYIVAGQRADFGFIGDVGRLPNKLEELVAFQANPPESSRWRGPYLRSTFNESPDAFRIDGWGDTIYYGRQQYNSNDSLWVRSYGGRGFMDRTRWQTVNLPYSYKALTDNTVSGQIVDVRNKSPVGHPHQDSIIPYLKVTLYQPIDGVLEIADRAALDAANFEFSLVPQGTHRLVAMYVNYIHPDIAPPKPDTFTTTQDVPVYPGIGARNITLRLPVDWDTQP